VVFFNSFIDVLTTPPIVGKVDKLPSL